MAALTVSHGLAPVSANSRRLSWFDLAQPVGLGPVVAPTLGIERSGLGRRLNRVGTDEAARSCSPGGHGRNAIAGSRHTSCTGFGAAAAAEKAPRCRSPFDNRYPGHGAADDSIIACSDRSSPLIPNGTYTNGPGGDATHFRSLTKGPDGTLSGSANFVYQDDQPSLVCTFDGSVENCVATLRPVSIPPGGGSASQGRPAVPSAISGTLGQNSASASGRPTCTSFNHWPGVSSRSRQEVCNDIEGSERLPTPQTSTPVTRASSLARGLSIAVARPESDRQNGFPPDAFGQR
jgi:hypothetical protein